MKPIVKDGFVITCEDVEVPNVWFKIFKDFRGSPIFTQFKITIQTLSDMPSEFIRDFIWSQTKEFRKAIDKEIQYRKEKDHEKTD